MQRRIAASFARPASAPARRRPSLSSSALLVALVTALVLPGCASSPVEESEPAELAEPPVESRALAASLHLSLTRALTGGAVYLQSRGEDRIALFPGTHTSTVRGVKHATQEPITERGSEVWISGLDARILRAMWNQGVHVGPSRSTATAFRGDAGAGSPPRGAKPLTMADLGPPPSTVAPARAPTSSLGAATAAERRAWSVPLRRSWQYIVVHHSATPAGSAAAFHKAHRARGWDGLGYHFVIGNGNQSPDGRIEVGFRWDDQREGAHAGNDLMNQRGIGICLVGDFNKTSPTAAQMRSLRRLCDFLSAYCEIAPQNLRLHRDFRQTACPGSHFPRTFALRPPAAIRAAVAGSGQSPGSATEPR